MMNPTFQSLLNLNCELTKYLEQLLTLLQDESIALGNRDTEAIQSIAAKKRTLVNQIHDITTAQNHYLSRQSLPDGLDGIKQYTTRLQLNGHPEAASRLAETLNEIFDLTKHCQDHNEKNGAVITLLSRHTNRSIEILYGLRTNTSTYGPDGFADHDKPSRSLISV